MENPKRVYVNKKFLLMDKILCVSEFLKNRLPMMNRSIQYRHIFLGYIRFDNGIVIVCGQWT